MTIQPYSKEFFAPRPSGFVLFFRTFFLWQLFRFVWINVKMVKMIGRAHGHHVDPAHPHGPGLPGGSGEKHAGPAAAPAQR